METKVLVEKVKEIEMPKEMRERIIRNCYIETEEKLMSKNTTKNLFKRPMVAVASLALCICLTGVTALAATGKLQGFFKDITDWRGAVTGTTYEQATDEVELSVVAGENALELTVTMVNPKAAPYGFFETLAVESYKIVDANGKAVLEGNTTDAVNVVDGKVMISIPVENLAGGEYKLVVTELVGSAKADQPLVISGAWECGFTR